MDARALTEEHPRTAATIAADALDVCERIQAPGGHYHTAWQLARVARQVAELAQLVDVVPAEIVDGEPDPRDAALDQIAATLRAADWYGVMYDDDALYEIHAIITGTGRDAGPR